jgi:hypothetical protein
MPFNGGGGGALPPHEHTNIANDGGPLDFNNTTIGSMNAGDITFSDGAALQQLAYPAVPAGETLTAAALSTAPSWAAAGPSSAVWTELADVTIGAQGQLSSGVFAAHDMLDVWICGANSTAQNTAVTFNNSAAADYKNQQMVDGVFAANAGNNEIPIYGGNIQDEPFFIHLSIWNLPMASSPGPPVGSIGYTWNAVNFDSSFNNAIASIGWGKYFSGNAVTQIDKSQYGSVLLDQNAGARIVVLGAN